MAELPSEILTEILSRLPVKLILRFKCVCKYWNSLIKTPDFIKLHLNKTLDSSSYLHLLRWSEFSSSIHYSELNLHDNNLYFSELRQPLGTRKIYFFGSCNGVICISDTSKNDVVLFNPLTKSHLKLPHLANPIPNLHIGAMIFGFGYDSKEDEYKVLRIVQGFNKHDLSFYNEANVFNVRTCAWKSVQGIPYNLMYADSYGGVFVNEALHYMVFYDVSDSEMIRYIAGFDLRTESFSLMDFPCFDDRLRDDTEHVEFFLRELGGCLCVVVNYHTRHFAHLVLPGNDVIGNNILYRADLWVMKEYGNKESWINLFSMNILELRSDRIDSRMCLRPVFCSDDGQRLLIELDYVKVGWYDPVSKEFTKVTSHGLPEKILDSGTFVGSLVSLEDKVQSKRDPLLVESSCNRMDSDNILSAGFKLKL